MNRNQAVARFLSYCVKIQNAFNVELVLKSSFRLRSVVLFVLFQAIFSLFSLLMINRVKNLCYFCQLKQSCLPLVVNVREDQPEKTCRITQNTSKLNQLNPLVNIGGSHSVKRPTLSTLASPTSNPRQFLLSKIYFEISVS